MRFKLLLICFIACTLSSGTFKSEEHWTPLLDGNLSQWEMYLSFRHKPGYKGEAPEDAKGVPLEPIGYNKNVGNVFSVVMENNKPVLKISGEIYGCVFTKKEFENYHLQLKVKWGTRKWEPRLQEPMDSGILYHSQGACGIDYWRSWMLSQEFQIIEKSMGDYWCIANSQIDIKAQKATGSNTFKYNKAGTKSAFGYQTLNGNFCQAGADYEKQKGEWNTLDLICFGDKSLHIVNGKVVMALSGSRYADGQTSKALTKGKIQLQSEAAEVFFKDVQIRKINELPEEYRHLFEE